jgi:anti-sigma B factor antagonist
VSDAGGLPSGIIGSGFGVEQRWDGTSVVLAVRGEVDVATCPQLRSALLDVIERGASSVVIDLREVPFVDSSGLGVVVGAVKRLVERDTAANEGVPEVPLSVVGLQPSVRRVFELTGLGTLCEPAQPGSG